jgi:hypothetical protein
MKRFFAFLVGSVLFVGPLVQAVVIVPCPNVENWSFELPGDGKHKNWEAVPGWSSDTAAADSGVESDWPGSTDGVYAGFLMGSDPSVWQLTNVTIAAGETYVLSLDVRNNYTEALPAAVQIAIYYDDGLPRVMGSLTVNPTDTWTRFSLSWSVAAGGTSAAIGKRVGIELDNVTDGASWVGIDSVCLVPEPATLGLLLVGALGLMRRRAA